MLLFISFCEVPNYSFGLSVCLSVRNVALILMLILINVRSHLLFKFVSHLGPEPKIFGYLGLGLVLGLIYIWVFGSGSGFIP